ncbi:MAG: HAMP domain-containing protein [Spirochaetales bacterium]|nr:HAMP domain-containing protein [Spirochaetales bacterium]
MKIQSISHTTPTGLIVLILFYILLIALVLIFSQQIISNIQNIDSFTNILILILIFLFPLLLLGAIIVNIITLLRERARKLPGSSFKTKLIIFFVFVALLSVIPQALLSITFINSSINFWMNVKIVDVLEGGMKVALTYYSDKYENLKRFQKSPHLSYLLKDVKENPELVFEKVINANPDINFIQVFNEQGEELLSRGEQKEGMIENFSEIRNKSGFLPKKEEGSLSSLRSVSIIDISGNMYYVVFGIVFTKEFSDYASRITTHRSTFKQLERYRNIFQIVVIVFYFLFSLPILLLSILISFLLTGEIIRPIVHLEDATKRIAEGDFSFRILARSNDELSILVDSFNSMVSELDLSRKKLLHAEKITAWQEIAQRLAHEIKNPLTPIKLSAQRILKKYSEDKENFESILESAISAIIKEVDNLNDLLKEFNEFTRLSDLKPEVVSIKDIVAEVASIYKDLSQDIRINYEMLDQNIMIKCDPTQIKQVIVNLFKNAIQAMPDGGDIIVRGDVIIKGYSSYVRLQIRDTGTGIDDETKDKVFDPYFTTKKDGTGLGLSIVERIVFDHNGNIWFETKKGAGTTFFIDLPKLEN